MELRFSFDDGLVGDIKAANLLTKYGFKGTFYVPNSFKGKGIQASLKEVYDNIATKGHEIGGHTVSHPMDMKLLNDEQLDFELVNNKLMCEICLAKAPISKFCYPRGRHDERVRAAVEKAGYIEARTTKVLCITNETGDPFQTPTTIHMYPREEYEGKDWFDLAVKYIELAKATPDSFFSLWGHTNELDQFGYWEKFEELLKILSPINIGANGAQSL